MFTKEWSKGKVYKTIVHQLSKFYPAPSQQLQGIKKKKKNPCKTVHKNLLSLMQLHIVTLQILAIT